MQMHIPIKVYLSEVCEKFHCCNLIQFSLLDLITSENDRVMTPLLKNVTITSMV